ncbi:tripartite tricarboxylate transporter TctB family protein [Aquabacter sp. CN5-332]|uniref:tripartite tricarboxylate transporter TctB family protein n=1 Tax=Aquabacter sp. CN5-332 TaxID=3156608 RepID=UPI0032B37766
MPSPSMGRDSLGVPGTPPKGSARRDALIHHFLSWRDVYGGSLLAAIGVGTVCIGSTHSIGTLFHMGAGYFPIILGVLLTGLGCAIAVSAFLKGSGPVEMEPGETFHLPDIRGCSAIIAGMLSFVLFAAYVGFAPATFSLVFISAMGDRTMSWKGALGLACLMTGILIGLFWYALQIPLQLW